MRSVLLAALAALCLVFSSFQTSDSVSRCEAAKQTKWFKAVVEVTKWYEKNVPGYQKHISPLIDCPLVKCGVRDDCSGLLSACLQYYGLITDGAIYTSAGYARENSKIGKIMQQEFKPIKCSIKQEKDAYGDLLPGDILTCHDGKDYNHVTIYAGDGRFYDWGSKAPGKDAKTANPDVKDNYPQPVSSNINDKQMNYHIYTLIWRYVGKTL